MNNLFKKFVFKNSLVESHWFFLICKTISKILLELKVVPFATVLFKLQRKWHSENKEKLISRLHFWMHNFHISKINSTPRSSSTQNTRTPHQLIKTWKSPSLSRELKIFRFFYTLKRQARKLQTQSGVRSGSAKRKTSITPKSDLDSVEGKLRAARLSTYTTFRSLYFQSAGADGSFRVERQK